MSETYEDLKLLLDKENLFNKRYKFYLDYFTLSLLGVLLGFYIITLSDSVILQSLNGIFLAIVFMQIGFIGHDASHGQVFKSKFKGRFLGKICFGLMLGISEEHWFKQHNEHHKEVNHDGRDPDLEIPFIFDKNQSVENLPWLTRRILPYQHYTFFLSMPIWAIRKIIDVFIKNLLDFSWKGLGEVAISLLHFFILFYFLFSYLSILTILCFLTAHFIVVGFYMGIAFAPNHKGEQVIKKDDKVVWTDQITSTRNLYMNTFIFHATGGLNLQIEHHLFPYMPRPNYTLAQPIVKDFCKRNNLEYSEMSLWESLKEIFQALKENSTRLKY